MIFIMSHQSLTPYLNSHNSHHPFLPPTPQILTHTNRSPNHHVRFTKNTSRFLTLMSVSLPHTSVSLKTHPASLL